MWTLNVLTLSKHYGVTLARENILYRDITKRLLELYPEVKYTAKWEK